MKPTATASAPRRFETDSVRIGNNLARLRKERGITQVEIAGLLGLPQQMVSKYECGQLRLHAPLLVNLAAILRVSADQILGLGKRAEPDAPEDRRFRKRLQLIDRLTRRDKVALLRTIDAFLERADLKKSA